MTDDELLEELRSDTPWYAREFLKIVDKRAELVPLEPRPWQLRFDQAMREQEEQGRPIRIIVLKARKLGFSTWVQAKLFHRTTLRPNRRALVVAQDNDTAGELFAMSEIFHRNMPDDPLLKPPITAKRRGKLMVFGGETDDDMGLNSKLEIDTAKEVQAGRGYTYHYLHCSEVAFWQDASKLTSLLNAVPNVPDTIVVLESTANSINFFKRRWDRAVRGQGAYVPVFAPWHEDPELAIGFASPQERELFVASIGTGPWGHDEPDLVERYGCTPEQLHWRREAIVDQCEANLDVFRQEYPATPEEAFISSGAHVFSQVLVGQVLRDTEVTDPDLPDEVHPGPDTGVLIVGREEMRRTVRGEQSVPTSAIWTPRAATGFGPEHAFWRVWEHPVRLEDEEVKPAEERREPGQYVIGVDVAGGDEMAGNDRAYHAIEVIDHRTRLQVAEYRSRCDPHDLGVQALLAAYYYTSAPWLFPWLGVETTGGFGASIALWLWKVAMYPGTYFRQPLHGRTEKAQDRLGWDTNKATKRILEDGLKQQLADGSHGIRSRGLALEMTTYVVLNERGRTGPAPGEFSDRLMAYMIAQEIAHEKRMRASDAASRVVDMWERPRNPRTGY